MKAIFAEVPTLQAADRERRAFVGPFGTEATASESALSARLPAVESSSAAREGVVADAAERHGREDGARDEGGED